MSKGRAAGNRLLHSQVLFHLALFARKSLSLLPHEQSSLLVNPYSVRDGRIELPTTVWKTVILPLN